MRVNIQEELIRLISDKFSSDVGYLYDVITSLLDHSPILEKLNLSILTLNVILGCDDISYRNSFSVQFDHRGFLFDRENDKMKIISDMDISCLKNDAFTWHYSYLMSFTERDPDRVNGFKDDLAKTIEDSYKVSDFSYNYKFNDFHLFPKY